MSDASVLDGLDFHLTCQMGATAHECALPVIVMLSCRTRGCERAFWVCTRHRDELLTFPRGGLLGCNDCGQMSSDWSRVFGLKAIR